MELNRLQTSIGAYLILGCIGDYDFIRIEERYLAIYDELQAREALY